MDEVLITVEGRRAVDGAVFANVQAPEWHALAAGLLPRGLEVAITEMSQGASAQVTCVYMYNILVHMKTCCIRSRDVRHPHDFLRMLIV